MPTAASIRRYWDFKFEEPAQPSGDAEEYALELDRLFRQAVGRQLVSDVPVGSYLSGGMDTGAVTSLASAEMPGMRTFTIGFDLSSASGLELGFDERSQAERISYLLGTEQYEMVLKAGDMQRAMPEVVRHIEEPRVGQSYPNFYAAKLAGSFGKVVLSGAGGDELFAGYPWRYFRAAQSSGFDDYVDRYFGFWQRLVPEGVVDQFFRPVSSGGGMERSREIFASVFDGVRGNVETPADYINSPGGVVTSGMAIYDTMQYVRPQISTLVFGQAASAGSLLLMAGHKGKRFALPNARIMIHQPSGGAQGQATDIEIHAREILSTRARLNQMYVTHTGRTIEEIERAMERDKFFSPPEAKEFGLIDDVLEKRPTPTIQAAAS